MNICAHALVYVSLNNKIITSKRKIIAIKCGMNKLIEIIILFDKIPFFFFIIEFIHEMSNFNKLPPNEITIKLYDHLK